MAFKKIRTIRNRILKYPPHSRSVVFDPTQSDQRSNISDQMFLLNLHLQCAAVLDHQVVLLAIQEHEQIDFQAKDSLGSSCP